MTVMRRVGGPEEEETGEVSDEIYYQGINLIRNNIKNGTDNPLIY